MMPRSEHGPPVPTPALRAYLQREFDLGWIETGASLPLDDEPFVECWQRWVEESGRRGVFEVLVAALPQLRFPIRQGISQSDAYRAATRRGRPPEELREACGLDLERPLDLGIELHPTAAGRIPVLVARHRADFVRLVRALAHRNEPVPVPAAQGAAVVSGYVNWTRAREASEKLGRMPTTTEKHLYQDRFLLLSDGPYSGVTAAALGLDEAAWRETSLALRRDHEAAHYLTRRLLGSMRNHLHDELIADYAGMTAATGCFRADWLRIFLGLGAAEGRVLLYRGDPPLSGDDLARAEELVDRCADQVEAFERSRGGGRSWRERVGPVLALASLGLDEIGRPDGAERIAVACRRIEAAVRWHRAPA